MGVKSKTRNWIRSSLVALLISAALLGCSSLSPLEIDHTTQTAELAVTPTEVAATPTEMGVETSNSPDTSRLTGTITLETQTTTSLSTTIELRNQENFSSVKQAMSSIDGSYLFTDLPPGSSNLWIRIPKTLEADEGCVDLYLPESGWTWGVKFGEIRGVSLDTVSMEEALLLAANIQSPVKADDDLFAVWQGVDISPGSTQQLDLDITCK